MVVCCKSTMPDSGRGRLTPSKRKFLRAAAILQLAQLFILVIYIVVVLGTPLLGHVPIA
jgi:hypothetical protein